MLTCGIVGLPQVGKTTIFNLLTGSQAEVGYAGKVEARVAVAAVPDPRLNFLSELFHPRKTTPAQIEFTDIPGLTPGTGGSGAFLAHVRQVDALMHVLRAFPDAQIPHVNGSVDPARDLETVAMELLLADLDLVEKRLQRLAVRKKKKENQQEEELLQKCRVVLEEEKPLSSATFTPEEEGALRSYGFLTRKPLFLVVNAGEDQLQATEEAETLTTLRRQAADRGYPLLVLSAKVEQEIAALPPAEQKPFLEAMGIDEPGINKVARAAYQLLGLISFFTAGEDEVKAWTITQGTPAKQAAGKIHSDIERGFIRAEVVAYADLARLGSMARVREAGLFRLEGKEYLVQDGDIINFRFNI